MNIFHCESSSTENSRFILYRLPTGWQHLPAIRGIIYYLPRLRLNNVGSHRYVSLDSPFLITRVNNMSSRHGSQSMSHPIIILHLVWCISHSNSWSTSLALTKVFLGMDVKFPNPIFLNFENKIYRSLARGLRQNSWQ
jgi:hypothetical protein